MCEHLVVRDGDQMPAILHPSDSWKARRGSCFISFTFRVSVAISSLCSLLSQTLEGSACLSVLFLLTHRMVVSHVHLSTTQSLSPSTSRIAFVFFLPQGSREWSVLCLSV